MSKKFHLGKGSVTLLAELIADMLETRIEARLARATGQSGPNVGGLPLLDYMMDSLRKKPSPALKGCLRCLKNWRGGGARLFDITPSWVEDFQRHLLNEAGLSQGSASLYSSALRRQLRIAVRDGLILKNPAEAVRSIPMPQSKKRPLSLLELRRLCKIPINGALGKEIKRAFLFACFTGLRISDLRGLKRSMFYERSDGSLWICKEQKKTKTPVWIPLHKRAMAILLEASEKSLMPKMIGQPWTCPQFSDGLVFPLLAATKTNTDQYLKKWGLKAGISHVSWHTARHTMATLALENGAELRTVSELLGHTSISTTLRYASSTDRLKEAAIKAIPDL